MYTQIGRNAIELNIELSIIQPGLYYGFLHWKLNKLNNKKKEQSVEAKTKQN